MMAMEPGMILDRDLTPELLDVALRIANDPTAWRDKRKLLTVTLRDFVSAQEAQGKTKKCLTRVWINPPPTARDMVSWGREHFQLAHDRRVIHLGALLATFPFVGAVTATVGRFLALEGEADPVAVRRKTQARWGDRSSIDVGARKAYTTLLRMGVLTGGNRSPLRPGEVLAADGEVASWLVHALLLARGVSSIDEDLLRTAPELFWVNLGRPSPTYPFLERHSEGLRRAVWAPTISDRGNDGEASSSAREE